jgi:spore cortex biosynthesis protein YabQ
MSLTTQFYTMLAMIAMGSFFGASFDTYNRFLKRSKRKRWIVFIHDVLFWVVEGLLIFYILFLVNYGEIRFYIFLALLCGFAAYQALLKRGYLVILESAIAFVAAVYKFILKTLYNLIYIPVKYIFLFTQTAIILIGKSIFVFTLAIWKVLFWFLKGAALPFQWVLIGFWKLLPKSFKIFVEKFFVRLKGSFGKIKNTITKLLAGIRKKK